MSRATQVTPKPDSTKSDGQLSSPGLVNLISGLSGPNGPTPRYQNLTTWLDFHTHLVDRPKLLST